MGGKQRDEGTNYQIGIFLGADWTVPEIAQFLGVTTQAVYARQQRPTSKPIIETASAWSRIAFSKHLEKRIEKLQDDFDERKKRLHTKGYKLIEKKVDHALSESITGDEIDQTDLHAAEMAIERTEGKPLDRKAILERHEHIYQRQVDGPDLDEILNEVATLNEMRRKALPAHVEESHDP